MNRQTTSKRADTAAQSIRAQARPVRAQADFDWSYAVDGYRWVRLPEPSHGLAWSPPGIERPWIVPNVANGRSAHIEPFATPALFRILAETPCTLRGVLRLVSQYGLLHSHGRDVHLEADIQWFWAIQQMRLTLALWDASRAKADDQVRAIAVNPGIVDRFWARPTTIDHAWPVEPDLPTLEIDSGDTSWFNSSAASLTANLVPAMTHRYAQTLRNMKQRRHAEDAVAEIVNDGLRSRLTLGRVGPKQRYGWEHEPKNLLDAIWLQLGDAIHDNAEFRKCRFKHCGNYIDMRYEHGKKEYCSPSCKTKQYYEDHPEKHPTYKRHHPPAPRLRAVKRG